MLENMLYAPTKRFIDHVKARDVIFSFHCCGNMMRFLPYFVEFGVDTLQIQRRAVDFIKLKELAGTKIGFGSGIEGFDMSQPPPSKDELIPMIQKTVDLFASTGGFTCSLMGLRDPELLWVAANEFYAYSREFYDKENA